MKPRNMKRLRRYSLVLLITAMIYAVVQFASGILPFGIWTRPWKITAIEIATALVAAFITDNLLYRYERSMRKRAVLPVTRWEIAKDFFKVYLLLFVTVNALLTPMAAFTDDGLQIKDIVMINTIPMLFNLLYFAVIRGNHYLQSYVQQQVQLEKLRNDQLQTELKFLKAQYHPHFLFNALNTIYFQMDEDVAGAKRTVEQFSDLLRYQLYDPQQEVPVQRELDYLQRYLALQQLRSERLKLEVYIDEALQQQQVFPLLLLPLVENAFKYVGGAHELSISASWTAPLMIFRVRNSVGGAPSLSLQTGKGIGLDNLRRRLELLYPGKHLLEIEQEEIFFTVTLTLSLSI